MKDIRPLSESHQYLLLGITSGAIVAICLMVVLSEEYSADQIMLAVIIGILCSTLMFISFLASWIVKHNNKKVYRRQSSSGKTTRKGGKIHYKTNLDSEINQRNQVSEQLKDKIEEIDQTE